MPRDIRIRAILDDQVSSELGKLAASLKGMQVTGAKGVSDVLSGAEKQTQNIIKSSGGKGLLGEALLGTFTGSLLGSNGKLPKPAQKGIKKLASTTMATLLEALAIEKKKYTAGMDMLLPLMSKREASQLVGTGYQTAQANVQRQIAVEKGIDPEVALSFVEISAVIAAASAALLAFNKIMRDVAQRADEIDVMAQKLGMGVVEFQELSYAAERLNVDMGSVTMAYKTIARAALESATGNKEMKNTFAALGVSVQDMAGNLKSPEKLFENVIEELGKIKSETARNAIAQRLLGRSYQELIPLIKASKDGMSALKKEAHDLNAVMSTQQILKLNELQDSYEKLGTAVKGAQQTLAVESSPTVKRFIDGMTEMSVSMGRLLSFPFLKMWETFVHTSAAGLKIVEAVFKTAGTLAGSIFISTISGIVLAGVTLFATTLGQLLPQKMQDALAGAQEKISEFISGTMGMTGETWKTEWAKVEKEWDKLNQIWEEDTAAVSTDKASDSTEEYLALLKKLLGTKSEEIDMDLLWLGTFLNIMNRRVDADKKVVTSMETRLDLMNKMTPAQENLAEIAMNAVGVESSLAEQRMRIMSEESRAYTQLELDQKNHLISFSEMQEAKNQVSLYANEQQRQASFDAFNETAGYAINLQESISGLMTQISNEQIKEIDKWEQREADRINNSLLAEEYKDAELKRLAAKADTRRKEEFEKQQALQIALAVVNTAAGFIQELGKEGIYGLITGALVLAAGTAEIATIAAESYAKGGIVPGTHETGDKVPARVNSGEMILTKQDQAEVLGAMRSGNLGGSVTISSPITIQGNADASTVSLMAKAHERHLEDVRSSIMELQYRGRLKAA